MAYYEWDPALETGNELIDTQHQGLFALANALALAVDSVPADEDAVADAVYGLAGYVVEHFRDEEELMDSFGYPGLQGHKAQHEAFAAEVMSFTARFMSGADIAPQQLASSVTSWLTIHIMQSDMDAVSFIRPHMASDAGAQRIR
jgi:hemerythrin